MTDPARKRATYQDVLDAPRHVVAELIHGVLHTHPRPATPHAMATSAVGIEIGSAFQFGRGGPGGWVILFEPELHFDQDIVVPDLAGWRRETLPEMPEAPFLTVAPDWICEALSPSTHAVDRSEKMDIYAREGVRHLWLIDAAVRTLEVYRLDSNAWLRLATHHGDAKIRAEPFDAVELNLANLWRR